ncbi:MAG: ABC transporter permease subunit [Microthrixaceae bacterium]|nr:ABC transporter permease subunit [Microthrixaceae bacterium]
MDRRIVESRITLPGKLLGKARRVSLSDVVVALAVMVMLYGIVRVGRGTAVSFAPETNRSIDTAVRNLPYYAARSLLRMFIALAASLVFSFVYAYAAARSRRAGKVLIPALDILQSVPILGFLSITVTGFIALFPGSLLGLEMASIFAIFTSQAWNMTFSFYHSLVTVPAELDELSKMLRLTRWQRFWRIDVPNGAIGLIWNGMMSMGGGWFFLVASEAITVSNKQYSLPGIGSFAGAAIADGDLVKVGWAILAMVVLVVGVNVLFWRPLVAWSELFRNEQSESASVTRSFVLDLLRRSHWPRALAALRCRMAVPLDAAMGRVFGTDDVVLETDEADRRLGDVVFWFVIGGLTAYGTWKLYSFVAHDEGPAVFWRPFWLGAVTFVRVIVLIVFATLIWVPIGAKIGLNPKAARIAQPLVQVLASFPANFLFPFATFIFIRTGLSLDIGGIVLMSLGAQWYILFNAIAGAMEIPSDLREAMEDLDVRGWQLWRRLIIPGVFPSYVTGGITASGGAWNASIVAETVTYGGVTLTATGLGAYIAAASETGDMRHVLAGVVVMSFYVVSINRFIWQPLFKVAQERYSL